MNINQFKIYQYLDIPQHCTIYSILKNNFPHIFKRLKKRLILNVNLYILPKIQITHMLNINI